MDSISGETGSYHIAWPPHLLLPRFPMFSKYTSTPLFTTTIQLIFAFGFSIAALFFGSIPLAALYFAMFSAGAVATAKPLWRTIISYLGVIMLLGFGIFLVVQKDPNIQLWYIGKIIFVVYYSIFISQILSTLVDKDKNRAVWVLGAVFLLCFVLELGASPEAQWLEPLKILAAESGGKYAWKDLIQDICFGIGAAIGIELYKHQGDEGQRVSKQ